MSQNETAVSILHAARDLFAEKGFSNISTRRIAKKAGVNEVTLFRHFGTKTALYESVFEFFGMTSGAYASFSRDSASRPEEALLEFSLSLYSFFRNNEPLVRMELREQSFLEGKTIPVPIIANRNKNILAEYIARSYGVPSAEAEATAVSLLCSIWGIYMANHIVCAFSPEPDSDACITAFVQALADSLARHRATPEADPTADFSDRASVDSPTTALPTAATGGLR